MLGGGARPTFSLHLAGGGSSPTARAAVAKGFAERSRGHRAKVSSGFPKRSFGLLFAGGVARRLLALLSPKGSLSTPSASSCEVGWAQREGCPSGRYSLTQASRKPPPLGASTGVVGGPLGLAVSWRAWQESSALRAALRAPKGTFYNRKRACGHPQWTLLAGTPVDPTRVWSMWFRVFILSLSEQIRMGS